MYHLSRIRTGDLLFFTNNTQIGTGLKFFTSATWTHIGVALRLLESNQISLDGSGSLYILESTRKHRYDVNTVRLGDGFGLTPLDFLLENQTLAAVRPLKSECRTFEIIPRIRDFMENYSLATFPQNYTPFLSAWLRLPLGSTGVRSSSQNSTHFELFCSEMVVYFYRHIFQLTSTSQILGPHVPSIPSLISPGDFDPIYSPEAPIFEANLIVFHRSPDSFMATLFLPIVVSIVIGSILILLLTYLAPLTEMTDDASERLISLSNSQLKIS